MTSREVFYAGAVTLFLGALFCFFALPSQWTGPYRATAILVASYHAFRGHVLERRQYREQKRKAEGGWFPQRFQWKDSELWIGWYLFTPLRNFVFTLSGFVALSVEWPFLLEAMRYPSTLIDLHAGAAALHIFLLAVAVAGISGWLPELAFNFAKSGRS